MWETDLVELFKTAQPAGIVFMLDHVDMSTHKEALNFVLQMIDEDERTRKNLRAFLILVNKSDLWDEDTTLETLLDEYRNEMRRSRLILVRRVSSLTCELKRGTTSPPPAVGDGSKPSSPPLPFLSHSIRVVLPVCRAPSTMKGRP